MRKPNAREITLLAVLVAAGLVAMYYKPGAGLFGGDAAPPTKETKPYADAPRVDLDLLAMRVEGGSSRGRDLFQYYVPPPPPPPPQPVQPPVAVRPPVETTEAFPPVPPPRPMPPVEPPPPTPGFHYIGYLGPKEDRIAVFETGTGTMLVRLGEVVEDRYRLLEFRYESVVLGYEDSRWKGKTTELRMPPAK